MGGGVWTRVGVGLVFLLGAQSMVLAYRRLPSTPEGPAVGGRLPDALVAGVAGQSQSLTNILASGATCHLVVAVSAECAVCQQMRDWWPAAFASWRDSTRTSVSAIWLSSSDSVALEAFYGPYPLPTVDKLRLVQRSDSLLHRLGIYAVPTTYLLDRSGRLRVGLLDFGFPPLDSARAACA